MMWCIFKTTAEYPFGNTASLNVKSREFNKVNFSFTIVFSKFLKSCSSLTLTTSISKGL